MSTKPTKLSVTLNQTFQLITPRGTVFLVIQQPGDDEKFRVVEFEDASSGVVRDIIETTNCFSVEDIFDAMYDTKVNLEILPIKEPEMKDWLIVTNYLGDKTEYKAQGLNPVDALHNVKDEVILGEVESITRVYQ